MKRLILILGFITIHNCGFGQNISTKDSLKIHKAIKKVILNFEKPNYKEFEKTTTLEVYCIICEGTLNSKLDPYVIYREDFYKKHLLSIRDSKKWQKVVASKEVKLVVANNKRANIIAYITTWKKNEWKKGHEGEQVGIYFKKIGTEFKFAGIETIP